MPLFKFSNLSDYISGSGTITVPAPVFLSYGVVLGREGDVEFVVPASTFNVVGDAFVNFGIPVPKFSARGNEQCDCELLITVPILTADGYVSIEGIVALDIPTSKLSAFGENSASLVVPSANLAVSGNVSVYGDGAFSVPAVKLVVQATIAQFGDAEFKITVPKFLATLGANSVFGTAEFLVPSLYFTASGTIHVEDAPEESSDVILRFEHRRRLI